MPESAITPPGWVFAVVWPVLYACLGLALAMVLHARGAKGRCANAVIRAKDLSEDAGITRGGDRAARGRAIAHAAGDRRADEQGRLARALDAAKPDLVVNAAAYTAVDRAESEPDAAFAINARAVGEMAEQVASAGAGLLHYSTDYVFDGSGQRRWQEDDVTGPLNVYGRSKLEGERRALAVAQKFQSPCWIIRTSWVYSPSGRNFLTTILRLARERTSLAVVDDQVGAPTSTRLLARVSAALLKRRPESGLYHLAPRGETSWFGFACCLLEAAGGASRGFLEVEAVEAVPSSNFPQIAARPGNSRLGCDKICRALNIDLPNWTEDVQWATKQAVTSIAA